jgi:hypothetical protein
MTDTNQEPELLDNDEDEELLPGLYVEKKTKIIYEVKFFDNCVLVRPATPGLYLAIRRISHDEFSKDFDEFSGDTKEVREFIKGKNREFEVS